MTEQQLRMEERLNALADGELDAAESEELLELIEQDANLRGELCDIHRIKDMVHYAYPDDQMAAQPAGPTTRKNLGWAVAATLLFTFGALTGSIITRESTELSPFTLAQVETQQPNKIVLYVNESNPVKFQRALDKAEHLLKASHDHSVEINIVASAGGIDMLRDHVSPVSSQIRTLASNYQALQFIACNNTLAKKKREGQPVKLMREASVAPSAVEFIVGRLQEGWSYVAI